MNRNFYNTGLLLSIALLAGTVRAADEADIRSRGEELIKALVDRNAEEVDGFWTSSGEYVREDITIRGRENIRKAYAEHLKKKTSGKLSILNDKVRFLSDTVAVQEGTMAIERDNPANSIRSKFSALYVKSDGKWYIGMLREESGRPSLAELAWMIGDWKFKTASGEATMSVQTTKQQRYLLVRTTVREMGEESIATQILGIDPATGGLRSWSFESDGSIGNADWVRTEKGWLAVVTATSADGAKVKAVTTITPSNRDAFTFASTERTVDGEKAPDVAPVKVTRVKGTR